MKKILIVLIFLFQLVLSFPSKAEPIAEARALLSNNQPTKALDILSTLDGDKLSSEAEFLLADAYLRTNNIEKSIEHAIKSVELDPKSSESHMVFAEAQGLKLANGKGGALKKLGIVKKVRKSFELAVNLDSDNIRARNGLAQFYLMAPGIAGGSKKKALKQAQAIFAIDKERGYPILAEVYRSTKKTQQLSDTLINWQKDFPANWNAVISTARYEQSLNNHAKAYELLNQWLVKNPSDLAAQYQLGRLAATSGEFLNEGESSLKSYLSTPKIEGQPEYQWAHYRIAMIYQHKNQPELAKEHVNKGLELDPNNEELLKLKANL